MKNIMKFFTLALILTGFSANSFGQVSATATSSASATILATLTIENDVPLNFGTIGPHATEAKTVVVTNAGATTGSTATLYSSLGAPAAAGEFSITGTPNATFGITYPSATVNLSGPGTAMTILSASWSGDLGTSSTLDASGNKTLNVGATLNVGIAQTPGDYTGSYDITIAYN